MYMYMQMFPSLPTHVYVFDCPYTAHTCTCTYHIANTRAGAMLLISSHTTCTTNLHSLYMCSIICFTFPETISSLQETIQKQKKEVDELKAKRLQLTHQRHTRELDYTVRSHDTPAPITMRSHDTPAPIKRRKIATAPPPKSYSGFTSTIQTTPTTHQTTPTTIKAPPPTRTSHLVSSILDNLSKPLPPHKPTTPPSREPRPPIITPSSWKTGQENVNRVLGKGPTLTNREASDSSDLLKHPNTNAAILLQDLEDSESEDEIDRIVKRRATGPSSVAVKLRRVLETSAG